MSSVGKGNSTVQNDPRLKSENTKIDDKKKPDSLEHENAHIQDKTIKDTSTIENSQGSIDPEIIQFEDDFLTGDPLNDEKANFEGITNKKTFSEVVGDIFYYAGPPVVGAAAGVVSGALVGGAIGALVGVIGGGVATVPLAILGAKIGAVVGGVIGGAIGTAISVVKAKLDSAFSGGE
jgi:hypothetical protein